MVKITDVRDPYAEIFPTIQFAEFDLLDGNLHELEDLSGRRVFDMNRKGIYIVNGKKVLK